MDMISIFLNIGARSIFVARVEHDTGVCQELRIVGNLAKTSRTKFLGVLCNTGKEKC